MIELTSREQFTLGMRQSFDELLKRAVGATIVMLIGSQATITLELAGNEQAAEKEWEAAEGGN